MTGDPTAIAVLDRRRIVISLPEILSSHASIHTAEGAFFRKALWTACERLNLSVTALRERDLDERLNRVFGRIAPRLDQTIASLKKSLGRPWTEDQKKAMLAALIVLKEN